MRGCPVWLSPRIWPRIGACLLPAPVQGVGTSHRVTVMPPGWFWAPSRPPPPVVLTYGPGGGGEGGPVNMRITGPSPAPNPLTAPTSLGVGASVPSAALKVRRRLSLKVRQRLSLKVWRRLSLKVRRRLSLASFLTSSRARRLAHWAPAALHTAAPEPLHLLFPLLHRQERLPSSPEGLYSGVTFPGTPSHPCVPYAASPLLPCSTHRCPTCCALCCLLC